MMRTVAAAALLALLSAGGVSGARAAPGRTSPRGALDATPAVAAPAVVTYAAPVPAPLSVRRGFDPPATRYGPGHLGVDLGVAPGQLVRSAGPGVVRFAGPVAGRGVVVIAHPDGVSTEYEPVHPLVRAGQSVQTGDPIGRLAGAHLGCPATDCLHWGARRASGYLDPLSLLRRLGPVRLLPWPGEG